MTEISTSLHVRTNLVFRVVLGFMLAILVVNAVLSFVHRSTDLAISSKVKRAVRTDPALKALDIAVETRDGVVILSGVVKSLLVKKSATERVVFLAHRVDGVRRVVDRLSVQSDSYLPSRISPLKALEQLPENDNARHW